MKAISDELQRIAILLNADYMRSTALDEANIQTHYKQISSNLIIYNEFGAILANYDGAEPIYNVTVEVYCLVKQTVIDATAESVDTQLDATRQMAADIIYNFQTVRDIETFTMTPESLLDDMLIGYRLDFSAPIAGDVCSNV